MVHIQDKPTSAGQEFTTRMVDPGPERWLSNQGPPWLRPNPSYHKVLFPGTYLDAACYETSDYLTLHL